MAGKGYVSVIWAKVRGRGGGRGLSACSFVRARNVPGRMEVRTVTPSPRSTLVLTPPRALASVAGSQAFVLYSGFQALLFSVAIQ